MKFSFIFFVFIIVGCGSGRMLSTFTEENSAIPPDFGKEGTILLVLKNDNIFAYNNFLKGAFKKNYFGDYVMIDDFELDSKEYADKQIYRYVFSFSDGTAYSSTYDNGQSIRTSGGNFKRYYVYDRLKEKNYQNVAEFSAYAKAMKAYARNLEAKRKKINNISSN